MKSNNRRSGVFGLVIVSILFSHAGYAQTRYVSTLGNDANDGLSWSTAKKTITAAVNTCEPNDSVWVAKGTYSEQVYIQLSFNISLYGGFAGDEADLSGRNWALNKTIITAGPTNVCVVCLSGSPRVDGFTISNSRRGISCANSSPTIINNVITGNYNYGSSGGGIYCSNSSARIINNIIAGNGAESDLNYYGGGIYCESSSPVLIHNTIVKNIAFYGGGIYFKNSSPTIINTIVAFNSSGIYRSDSLGLPVFGNNCVYGNHTYNYAGITDPTGTDGNISADPDFVSTEYGDFHIQPGSTCIDAGSNGNVGSESDIDGQQRIQPQAGLVDIGADECDGITRTYEPEVIIRVSLDGNNANDGSTWTLAKRTIGVAINAVNGRNGEIWVKQGTYMERITLKSFIHLYGGFNGTEILKEERNVPAYPTIINGSGTGTVVSITGIACCTVDGFTLTHGALGAGIFDSLPILSNNTIKDNAGYGISCSNSCAKIRDNTIMKNLNRGIYISGLSPEISHNLIYDNYFVDKISFGGGIYCQYSQPIIINNVIWRNGGSPGGGIYIKSASPTIANNIIMYNVAMTGSSWNGPGSGGGIYCEGSSSPKIVNNTIYQNSAADGGGIYSENIVLDIANNIVAFNENGIHIPAGSTLRNNCVYGNTEYNYSGITDQTGINGNISSDPNFVCTDYRNLHLPPGSACIDAGSNDDAAWDTDIDGQPRIQPAGGTVDIGADEFDGTIWPAANVVIRVSPDGNDANDGLTWETAKKTVQTGIDAAFMKGGDVWVKAGTYQGQFSVKPFVHLYGGFDGTEQEREQRNWTFNTTTLNAMYAGTVVTASGSVVTAIDGFTITRGYTTNPNAAGGIYCGGTTIKIRNNIISYNRGDFGGGINSGSCPLELINNRIVANQGTYGGGVHCTTLDSVISGNEFSGNIASSCGGGIYSDGPISGQGPCAVIVNNQFVGNTAANGGGVYFPNRPVKLINNSFIANTATSEGAAIYGYYSLNTVVANNIIAFNSWAVRMNGTAIDSVFNNNCIYGNECPCSDMARLIGVNGNISADPNFVRQPYSGTDGQWGTADDDYGDLRLTAGSHCIDAGDNTSLPADVLADLVQEPRITDGNCDAELVVDMGAYEYYLPGDLYMTCSVDIHDFNLFALQWLQIDCTKPDNCSQADVDRDGTVDTNDLNIFAGHWLEGI